MTPDQVPLRFFQSLQQEDYQSTWELLTRHSQAKFIDNLVRSWKGQQANVLEHTFAKALFPAQLYWREFKKSLDLKTWLDQRYQQLGQGETEVIVKATPSEVHLLVYKENQQWKLGYIETFLEN